MTDSRFENLKEIFPEIFDLGKTFQTFAVNQLLVFFDIHVCLIIFT